MSPRRAILAAVAAAVATTAAAVPAAAGGTSPAPTDQAHLSGSFVMSGRVTVASNIPGEKAGQLVSRQWGFHANCPSGPCETVTLVRPRATGRDTVVLTQTGPGLYSGPGVFYAPVRCARHVWPRGALVPFTITVRITTATATNTDIVTTAITATYINRARINRTPCVAVLGHDAASYTGTLLVPPPAAAGV
jgi:hypothetical protein